MSNILLTNEGEEKEETEKINYTPTERDEQEFFIMYHMNMQPSEVKALSNDYLKWVIARFIAQKQLEQEAMERHRLMSAIGPNLKSQ